MSPRKVLATRWLLFVYCVLFGILSGAGLYQHFVIVPGWDRGADILRTYQHGYGFFPFVTPPLTLVAIVLAFVAWRSPQPMKRWLYASLIPFFVFAGLTFAYYLPVLVRLEYDPLEAAEFARLKQTWVQLDRVRQLLGVLMLAAGIHAYGLSHRADVRASAGEPASA